MDSITNTDSIGITPLSTLKVETNFEFEDLQKQVEKLNCVNDNFSVQNDSNDFLRTSKSNFYKIDDNNMNSQTGEQFIVFMFKYYEEVMDENYIS